MLAGALGVGVGGVASFAALFFGGSVVGLSAAGITSGLAAAGAVVGGGMAAGVAVLAIATALQVTETLLFPYVAKHFGYGERFDPSQRLPHDDKSIENAHRAANDDFRDKNLNKHPTG